MLKVLKLVFTHFFKKALISRQNKKQLHTNSFQKSPAYKEFFSSNTDLIYSKCFDDFREILVQVNKSCLRKKTMNMGLESIKHSV